MFKKKKTIIYIQKNNLKVVKVILGKKPEIKQLNDYQWTKENFIELLQKIKKEFKAKNVRVLLDDQLSYVLTLNISLKEKDERSYILKQIKEKAPELIDKYDWDYKGIEENKKDKSKKKIKKTKQVVVFVPVKHFFNNFSLACKQADLHVELIESSSTAEKRNPDPIIGIALKKDIKEKDEEKQSEHKEEKRHEEPTDKPEVYLKSEDKEKKQFFNKKIILITISVIILTALIAGGIIVSQKAVNEQKKSKSLVSELKVTSPIPTKPSPDATPSALPKKKIERKNLKVKVLNGTGKYGVARAAKELLEEAGYENIEADNAESFDYKETVIQIKEDKKEYLETLKKDIEDNYKAQGESETLDNDNDFDAIIIIGEKKE